MRRKTIIHIAAVIVQTLGLAVLLYNMLYYSIVLNYAITSFSIIYLALIVVVYLLQICGLLFVKKKELFFFLAIVPEIISIVSTTIVDFLCWWEMFDGLATIISPSFFAWIILALKSMAYLSLSTRIMKIKFGDNSEIKIPILKGAFCFALAFCLMLATNIFSLRSESIKLKTIALSQTEFKDSRFNDWSKVERIKNFKEKEYKYMGFDYSLISVVIFAESDNNILICSDYYFPLYEKRPDGVVESITVLSLCNKDCKEYMEICALKKRIWKLDEKTDIYYFDDHNIYLINNNIFYCTCDKVDKTLKYDCATGKYEITNFDFKVFINR